MRTVSAAPRIFRPGKGRPDFRYGRNALIVQPRLLHDASGDPFRNPLASVGIGHSGIFLGIGQVRAFAKHATNVGIPSKPETATNHATIVFTGCAHQVRFDPSRESVTIGSPKIGFCAVGRGICCRVVMDADEDNSARSRDLLRSFRARRFFYRLPRVPQSLHPGLSSITPSAFPALSCVSISASFRIDSS